MRTSLGTTLPVIWTVSVSRLSGLLADVALEYADRARVHAIDLAFDDARQGIAERLRREHCDVVVAGGANAAFLRGRLEVPLVSVQASGFDLLNALTRARGIHPRVGLVTHAGDLPDVDGFARAFGLDLDHRQFDTREEARDCVAGLRAAGAGVIVGTGLAIDHAEALGLPGVLLYSADAVRRCFDQALQLVQPPAPADRPAATLRTARRPQRLSLLGDSTAMERVRQSIALYAPQSAPVWISGQSGTGKDLAARLLHAGSARHGRLIVLGCAGMDAAALEAALGSGDGRGGWPLLDAANGGSLLLDRLDELPLPLQGRLLRLIDATAQARNGGAGQDVRLMASSELPLPTLLDNGRLRPDLVHRLCALAVDLPSLQQRPQDTALLLDHYLAVGGPVVPLAASARDWLLARPWPGNVRQLRQVAERIALHWRHRPVGAVELEHLRDWLPELWATATNDDRTADTPALTTSGPRRRPDAESLRQQVHRLGGDRQRLMNHYGISRATLWRWLRAAGIS